MEFKVGDKIWDKVLRNRIYTVESVGTNFYYCGQSEEDSPYILPFEYEFQYTLYKPKKVSWLKKFFKKKDNAMERDLEKEIHNRVTKLHTVPTFDELNDFARYFVEWGMNHAKCKED